MATIPLGLLIALLLWVVAWRYIMPRMLGTEYRWREARLWSDSLTYVGINVGVVLAMAALAVGVFALAYFTGVLIGTAGFVAAGVVAVKIDAEIIPDQSGHLAPSDNRAIDPASQKHPQKRDHGHEPKAG